MGTLFSQQPRWNHEGTNKVDESDLDEFLQLASKLAKEYNISVSDVIAAKHALELARQTNTFINDGDIRDEQLMGFGELLQELNSNLERIGRALEDNS